MSAPSIVARVKAVPADAPSSVIAEIVAALKADLAEAVAEAGRLKASRSATLLGGDDAALVALDAAVTAAGYRQERATLLLSEMDGRLKRRSGQEESWAAAARLDALRDEATALSANLQAGYESGYAQPARQIGAFLEEWYAGHKRLAEINKKLREAKRHDDQVQTPEQALRSAPMFDPDEPDEVRYAWFLDGRELGPDDMKLDRMGKSVPKDRRASESMVVMKTKPSHSPGETMLSLSRTVSLPAVKWGEKAPWTPSDMREGIEVRR